MVAQAVNQMESGLGGNQAPVRNLFLSTFWWGRIGPKSRMSLFSLSYAARNNRTLEQLVRSLLPQ